MAREPGQAVRLPARSTRCPGWTSLTLMYLRKTSNQTEVNEFIKMMLRRDAFVPHLLQAPIEMIPEGSEERITLENISDHLATQGVEAEPSPLIYV